MTAPVGVRTPVPPAKAVRDVLAEALSREVDVSPGVPVVPRPGAPASIAVFTDRFLAVRAVVVLDLRLSAYVGAALGLVPVTGAEEAVTAGELPEALAENVHEVLDMVARVFAGEDAPPLTLYQVVGLGELPPSDISVLCRTLGRRLDLAVDVHGYGAGALSVILPAA